ncbi:MAG: UDP-N-acetylglucosamine 1-carboxyvinyltransferase [bacterium]|nr:UDP-N-acetylglucosamine 1-carboxyvinyltransferase [bacterium]
MSKFEIQGGHSLNGEVEISGAKNAALKMMAASLLTNKKVILRNVPNISDILAMKDILEDLGAVIVFEDNVMELDCSNITKQQLDYQLVKHLRGCVVVIGPMLSKFGNVSLPQPGGCLIGNRSIDTHLRALEQFGVQITEDKDIYHFDSKGLQGNKIILEEMSVTATENVMMAATLAKGKTEIRLAASEPEIVDLAKMLNSMGAKISGAGTSVITVEGVNKLNGTEHEVIPDRIEAGTFAIAAAVSRGDVKIKNIETEHLEYILHKFKQANVNYEIEDNHHSLHITATTEFKPLNIDTRPYPGYPTDLQAPLSVLLTQANGTSKIFETMYEGRLGYVKELTKMGAEIKDVDVHTIIISGPTPLYGKEITSFDIRAGATLIIAALIAEGKSTIDKVELVDRGYENIENRLTNLGANIKRI